MEEKEQCLMLRDNAKRQLEEIKSVETGINYLNKVKTLETWVKAEKKDAELQNMVAEQKIRTQRIIGQLIKQGQDRGEIAKASGRGANQYANITSNDICKTKKLSDIGITHNESSTFQRIADIPDDTFEKTIAEKKEIVNRAVSELTTAGMLKIAKEIKKEEKKEIQIKEIGFNPFIYNIWNTQSGDDKDYFGHFPEIFMKNLLYYHTKENDVIYDPFAGSGTTIDVCKAMRRQWICSDLNPSRDDVLKWDITEGIPEMNNPDLAFLDPPYWLLAKKEYSEDKNDLGNMTKEDFYKIFNNFIIKIKKRKIKLIAYVIRPIWITGFDWQWEDLMFNFYDIVKDEYNIEARYIMPYSTQQYSGLWVNRAKSKKRCLILNRELTIFKRLNG